VIAFWHGKAVSENERLAPGRGRYYTSDNYRAFKDSMVWTLKAHQEHYSGPVHVRMYLVLNPRMDAQNVVKPCMDALEQAGVIDNDRQVRSFSFYREDRKAKDEDVIGFIVTEMKEEKR